jgi:hypothetical protein
MALRARFLPFASRLGEAWMAGASAGAVQQRMGAAEWAMLVAGFVTGTQPARKGL